MDKEKYDAIVKYCLEKWKSRDKRIDFFEEHFEEWVLQLPVSVRDIIIELIKEFKYYTHQETNHLLQVLHAELLSKKDVEEEKTIFTYIHSKSGIANSSIEYWIDYKRMNEISKYQCFETIDKIPEDVWESIDNIAIIDDCCGSGKTIIDFVNNNRERLKGKNIYYIVIYIMSDSLIGIEQLKSKSNISVVPISACISEKAFNKEKWVADAENLRAQIIEVSKGKSIPEQYALGFKKTESLVSFHNNTPNNSLGLFWHDSDNYFSIFPRESSPQKLSLKTLKMEKDRRKAQNYGAKKRGRS